MSTGDIERAAASDAANAGHDSAVGTPAFRDNRDSGIGGR